MGKMIRKLAIKSLAIPAAVLLIICVGSHLMLPAELPRELQDLSPEQLNALTNLPFIRWLRSLPKSDVFVRDLAIRLRKSRDLPALSQWAQRLASESKGDRRIKAEEIPLTFRSIEPAFSPFGNVKRNPETGDSMVFVEWGGGFGHWGFVFTTNRAALQELRLQIEPVTNGIFAFVTIDAGGTDEEQPQQK
jgi:hypothetical protein